MVDPSYHKVNGMSFGGAWTLPDATQVPHTNALAAQNVRYVRGSERLQVGTRLGYSKVFATSDAMSGMFNWISDIGNFLFWYRTSDNSVQYIDVANQPGPQAQAIAGNLIGTAPTFAPAGARLILSFFDVNGIGASGAQVLTRSGGTFVSDLAFQPPLTYVPPAPVESASGVVTAGLHYFGYLIEYRSGFLTRPSPDSGVGSTPSVNTFNAVSMTASGGTHLTWTLTTTWPVGAINVRPIMTTATNPARWFIPQGLVQGVVGGVSSTVTFTINIQDDLLTATGQDVSNLLTIISNSVGNVPQFLPSAVLTHGNRAVWITTINNAVGGTSSAAYVSALGAYQQIDPVLSLIQLPGQRAIITAASMDGVLYFFGPQWTYQTSDNMGDPSTWSTPRLVDGSRGTLSVRGVQVAPSGTYAWVASQDGLYFFQGVFPPLPISYYQDTIWNRINWNVAQAVQIRDIPHLRKVQVMACLDSATTPNFLLTWDYTQGLAPSSVNFSLDFLQSYNMGAMEAVKNDVSSSVTAALKQQELWIGPSLAGLGILRDNQLTDLNPFQDNGFPVFATYETGLYPPEGTRISSGIVRYHHGADYRVTGNGTLQITTFSLDHVDTVVLALHTLLQTPGEKPHFGFDLISEGVSHQFTQGQNLVSDAEFEGGP